MNGWRAATKDVDDADAVMAALSPMVTGILDLMSGDDRTRPFVHSPLLAYLFSAPERADVITAARHDAALAKLITGHGDYGPFLRTTWGHGFRIPPQTLASAVIHSALMNVSIEGDELTQQTLLRAVGHSLTQLRELAHGGAVPHFRVIAFDGISLHAGIRVTTPWGTLISAPPLAQALSRATLVPTALLVQTRPVGVAIEEPPDESSTPVGEATARRRLEETSTPALLLPFTAMMAFDRSRGVFPCALTWEELVPGLIGSGQQGLPIARTRPVLTLGMPVDNGGETLSADEALHLEEWTRRVAEFYDPALNVAITRALRAMWNYGSTEDSLIDSVVALESLLGSRETTDATLRLRLATAILLESEEHARRDVFTAVGKILGMRGAIVHGRTTEAVKVAQSRTSSVNVLISVFRKLLAERTDLLSDPERGMSIILEAGTRDLSAERTA